VRLNCLPSLIASRDASLEPVDATRLQIAPARPFPLRAGGLPDGHIASRDIAAFCGSNGRD
jgi:hypothetical protein